MLDMTCGKITYMKEIASIFLIFLSFLIVSCDVFANCDIQNLKIIAIGDSVTQGGRRANEFSYRLPLSKMLVNNGYVVDFIGMQHGLEEESFKWPADFDNDHEGFYGATTAFVERALEVDLINLPSPDIALIELGNNDAGKLNLYNEIIVPMRLIIKMLRAKNTHITIMISSLHLNGYRFKYIRCYLYVLKWIENSEESKVIIVNMHDNWDSKDTFDGMHPSLTGQNKMAMNWLKSINLACRLN